MTFNKDFATLYAQQCRERLDRLKAGAAAVTEHAIAASPFGAKTGPRCNCYLGGPTGCAAPGCEGGPLPRVTDKPLADKTPTKPVTLKRDPK